jgi:hypothetical protein
MVKFLYNSNFDVFVIICPKRDFWSLFGEICMVLFANLVNTCMLRTYLFYQLLFI